jgi:hypothetical protein
MLIDHVNTELKKWVGWFRANKMAVNIGKTKFIIFQNRGKKIDLTDKKLLFDDNEPGLPHDPNKISERVRNNHVSKELRAYKRLGIHFDENLTFNHHVGHLISKLSKALFMINRVKNILPPHPPSLKINQLFTVSLAHS